MSAENVYWASLEGKELAARAEEKVKNFFRLRGEDTHRQRITKSCNYYYGWGDSTSSHQLLAGGEGGELTYINVNLLRYLVQHVISMVAGGRLVYKAIPQNTDVESREEAILGSAILNAYVRDLRLERLLSRTTEYGVVSSEGFCRVTWDTEAGEHAFTDETGKSVKKGEVRVDTFSYWDVFRDEDFASTSSDWVIVREFKNKYDLAAKYQEYAEDIIALSPQAFYGSDYTGPSYPTRADSPQVPVYTLYHERTPAVPNGKELVYLNEDIVLFSGDLSYREIPVYRLAPSDQRARPLGYTPVFDILSIIEAYNNIMSTILSNQLALGTQKVWTQKGDDLSVHDIAAGIVNVQTSGPKPEALNLVQTAEESFRFADDLRNTAITLMGLSETSLGTQSQRLSGNAMALLDQKSIQFMSVLQESYVYLAERVGQAIINLIQDYATTPRVVAIAGKKNKYMVKSFEAKDISGINRVVVETVAPEMRSFAVRLETANQWLAQGLITDKGTYMEMVSTGQIESEMEDEISKALLIDRENEYMKAGRFSEVIAIDTDQHIQHIIKHSCLLDDPDARMKPELVMGVLSHINEHIDALRMVDPELLQIIGQNPSQLNQQLAAQQRGTPDAVSPEAQSQEAVGEQQAQSQEAVNPDVEPAMPEPASPPEV